MKELEDVAVLKSSPQLDYADVPAELKPLPSRATLLPLICALPLVQAWRIIWIHSFISFRPRAASSIAGSLPGWVQLKQKGRCTGSIAEPPPLAPTTT
eukprot:SAG31_NODE_3956_length_3720_cov_1.296879_1_plen_97_part_10